MVPINSVAALARSSALQFPQISEWAPGKSEVTGVKLFEPFYRVAVRVVYATKNSLLLADEPKLGVGHICRSARARTSLANVSTSPFFVSIHPQLMNLCPPH